MKLNAKSASTWLAVPLLAIAIAACGDSDGPSEPGIDAGEPGQGVNAECGDGIVDVAPGTTEECDDGNDVDEDMCTNECQEAECGDGIVGPGEGCDEDSDTCIDCSTIDCGNGTVEGDEECDDGPANGDTGACTDACEPNVCGDGLVGPDEECDNGADNGDDGDICTSTCDEDTHGNGHVGPGEQCDDGNMVNDDDCTNDGGFPGCGDGIVQADEECDDGNNSDRDGCLSSCQEAICGDGEVQTGEEECDDGNASNTDGCTNDCMAPSCGDGYLQQGEGCDNGPENADDAECNTNCQTTDCGDGVVQAGEECDDGNTTNTDSCLTTCVWASCGDPYVYSNVSDDTNPNPVEECDDQNNSNADSCTNACMANVCGDGYVGPGEACDEGVDNGVAGGTCTATCTSPTCGNGVVEAGEECDDENTDETDSCAQCKWNSCGDSFTYATVTDPANTNPIEECDDGDETNTNTCTNACTLAVCGDSIVGPGEACDDGNDVDGDGCNSCAGTDCGNSIVDPGEECDDGNASNTDSCLTTCVWNGCGDGSVYLTETDATSPNDVEECDELNASNQDSCLTTCETNTCGDGFQNVGVEECDLGALNGPGSTCSAACTIGACGNGELDPGEDCDEGAGTPAYADNTDSCLSTCIWNSCGDGAIYATVSNNSNPNAVEQCDDANEDETDLCRATCVYNSCGDNSLLVGWDSEPYDDPDGTGPMTASRGAGGVPIWQAGLAQEISPFDFDADSEECDDGNTANTDACVRSDFDGDGVNECRVADCGDGFVQAGTEQCDDQNTNNNDSCIDTCEYNVCHDGWLYTSVTNPSNTAPLEQCDDGNTANNDSCVLECVNPTCGDGIIQPSEGCDNGALNGTPGNPCDSSCDITTCGDGVVQAANGEQCDDNNGSNGDQCLNTCRWNRCGDGFAYTTTIAGPNNAAPIEECDDGNGNNRDSCLTSCQDADCGDGEVWFMNEDCDDGNDVDNDECSNDCGAPDCGDGILQDGEECDDGGTCEGGLFAGQACDADSDCLIQNFDCEDTCVGGPNAGNVCDAAADCQFAGTCLNTSTCSAGTNSGNACTTDAQCPTVFDCTFVCNEATGRTVTACDTAAGDDATVGVDDDSECDTVYGGTRVAGSCSNGFCRQECDADTDCNAGETCLVAAGACDDGTSGTCTSNADCPGPDAACSSDICDGNSGAQSGDPCTTNADCVDNTPTCNGPTACDGGARDGLSCSTAYPAADHPECPEYDNCTAQDGDGCSNYDDPGTADVDEAICEFSRCGDGILDPTEGCEIDNSGVTPVILVHSGALAAGTTCDACVLSTCGANAGTQPGEQCDDGNTDNTDACTTSCRSAQCGDGIVQVGEECDDANGVETDECTNACEWNVCGDGVRFTEGTPNANTGALQLCDTGDLSGTAGIFSRGRDDGDGFDDQPAFCNAQCEVICDGTTGEGATLWKSNNWCLMAAEEYPLSLSNVGDATPLTLDNNLDDTVYTDFALDWDDAVEYCEDLGIGARLVQYDSVANAATLGGVMTTLEDGENWWLGAFDNFAEAPPVPSNPGRFVWLDDTAVTDGFVGGRPDGSGDCAAANSDNTPTGYMTDESCGTAYRFFCEYQGPFPRTAL